MPERKIIVYQSILEISEKAWDGILLPSDIFHTHRFIRTMELAKVEDSPCRPIAFYEGRVLVATAVLSWFCVDLTIFLDNRSRKVVRSVRRRFPRFLQPKILFCGLPISLGQRNLVIADPSAVSWVMEGLDRKMQEIAGEVRAKLLVMKEFDTETCQNWTVLLQHGYFKANSIPSMDLSMEWSSYGGYLADMRHSYRRQIKHSLKKIKNECISDADNWMSGNDQAICRINHWEACTPDLFYEMYLKVMDRTETKLETLNRDFFRHCFARHRDEMLLLTIEKDGEILSAGLLFPHAPFLTFALVANKYRVLSESDPYFNLIHAMVRLAIEEGFEQLKLGQTTYWIKQRVGALPSDRFLFLKANNRGVHFLLKMLREILFPALHLPLIRVFKRKN